MIDGNSSLITIELTQDGGFFYSALNPIDFTTGSSLTLYPKPVPQLSMTPSVTLRSKSVLLQLYGTFLDQLVSCSGKFTPLNATDAYCEIEVTPY